MTSALTYAVCTLAVWVGWAFMARWLWLTLALLTEPAGAGKGSKVIGASTCFIVGAVCLISGLLSPGVRGAGKPGEMSLPLVWFVMPFLAWASVALAIAMAVQLGQAFQALLPKERSTKLVSSAVCGLAAIGCFLLHQADPSGKVSILTGSIRFSLSTGVAVGLLAVAALLVMVLSARSAAAKGLARSVSVQLALLAGSVVFGLPFAFLLVTSFKEDRDMSSSGGIVWLPKVTERVAYRDPNNPLYASTHQGQGIEATVLRDLGGGRVLLDIQKPLSMRGLTVEQTRAQISEIPQEVPVVTAAIEGKEVRAMVTENLDDGRLRLRVLEPPALEGREQVFLPSEVRSVRHVGLNWKNYPEALSYMPPETQYGLVYLKNTLLIVVLSVIGTLLSSSLVGYAFSRMKFPGRERLFAILLATMMLPGAVTLLPQFLIFRSFGWIDTLYPLWVPAFFGSAFNIFLLRQFFLNIPMELEDAAKIDGCTYLKTFWSIMLPQIKPALAVIFLWTFLGAWNNFMGPLIYVNSAENMPLSYALQLFAGDRAGEPGYLMAFATLSMLPVLLIYVLFQRYFIEGVTLSGLGGR